MDDRTSFLALSPPSFSAEIIAEAVRSYFHFPLSFRMVEAMLAFRGIIVTNKTMREWDEKFGRRYANSIVVVRHGLLRNGTWTNV